MNDCISIVIPCYQAEKHLNHCIACLKKQTYKNLEIIFVDDGSTDSTLARLRELEKENNIVVLHEENAGVSVARNLGIKAATGKYLTFLDVDDTLDDEFCKKMLSYIRENNVELVGSKMEGLQYQDEFISDMENHTFDKVQLKVSFEFLYSNWFFHNACGKLYLSEIAKKCFFPRGVRVGEDLLFNLQYFRQINSCAMLNYYGYIYEVNLSSAVHRYYKSDFDTQRQLHSSSKKFYEDYFGESYSGKAINIVYINNVIDIVNVCMTWSTKANLRDAVSTVVNDDSLNRMLRIVPAIGKVRKFIQHNIIKKHVLLLYFVGQVNARRCK